jgi:hypothetical protein
MNILIACADFTTISGMPMFVYELSRCLASRGHSVTVTAPNVGGPMAEHARLVGVECLTFDQARNKRPDVLHVQEHHPANWAINTFPYAPAVSTVHSQLIYEIPFVHDRVRHYACVRPEILSKVVGSDGVPWQKTSVIFNGVDQRRFRPLDDKFDPPTILFAGTVDYLRAQAGALTMDWAAENGYEVAFVGRKLDAWLDSTPAHVNHVAQDVWEIQDIVGRCSMTAGILLGRTLIEGWSCGIPGLVFEIDEHGNVTNWGQYSPPPPQMMRVFDIEYMTDCYERLYATT